MKFKTLLVLSKNYPSTELPNSGTFVHERVKMLCKFYKVIVVAPVPYVPPIPLLKIFSKKWFSFRKIPKKHKLDDILILRPRYFIFPKSLFLSLQGYSLLFSLKKFLRREKICFDVIISHFAFPEGFAGAKVSIERKIPHYLTIHGSDINIYFQKKIVANFIYVALNISEHIFTVSKKLKEVISKKTPFGYKTTVVNNGYDPSSFYPKNKQKCKKTLAIEEKKNLIIYVGSITAKKGIFNLLIAYKKLANKLPNTLLYLIGPGDISRYKKICDKYKIKGTTFVGVVEHKKIPLWLNSANVLVLPSFSEGFPTILAEAIGTGVPVVASDVGGVNEIVNSSNGVLINPYSIVSIYDGLLYSLNKKWDLKKISRDSHYLSWENIVKKEISIINTVINQN